ncbi:Protein of unknown function DUF3505 [Fusarium oxysporum f. sp. vasinfectum]|nr:Protein of unknown function DUF3505 [Fusarium oxysporum f. sp. vasinfectum]
MAMIAQQHLPDSPPSNTNSDTQATGRRTDGSERGEGEGRWLLYNEEYQSLICAFHGYAVRFRNLEGHLKDCHLDLSHQVRSDLIRRHKGLLLTLLEEGPREDQLARHGSSNPAEPVEGLPIHRGFACTWPGCGYLTPSWKCLRMHFNDEHNAKAAKRKTQADLWAAVHLQTFFTGPKRAICYFCVRESKQGEMMYFMGKPILMEDLRTMVAKMTADAEDLLWGQLMFKEGNDERFVIPLAGIEDDLTQTRRGQSFIHRNGLAGKEVEMLEDLITSSRKTDLLDQTGEWKFEEFLLLLAHITGGQPSRGEEITGLRLINGINRDRNIFIIDGEVVLVTQYHKSLAHFDSPKVIPRFLPGRIGQLFVMYIIYIRPLTDR